MNRSGLIVFLLLWGTAYAVSASTVEEHHRPGTEAYVAESIGISFPPAIAHFRKTEVREWANPMIGTVVRYAAHDGSSADIYIYTLTPAVRKALSDSDAERHYRGAKESLLHLAGRHPVNTVELVSESSTIFRGVRWRTAFFKLALDNEVPRPAILTVFPFENRIIKVRITGISGGSEKSEIFTSFQEELPKLFQNSVR